MDRVRRGVHGLGISVFGSPPKETVQKVSITVRYYIITCKTFQTFYFKQLMFGHFLSYFGQQFQTLTLLKHSFNSIYLYKIWIRLKHWKNWKIVGLLHPQSFSRTPTQMALKLLQSFILNSKHFWPKIKITGTFLQVTVWITWLA